MSGVEANNLGVVTGQLVGDPVKSDGDRPRVFVVIAAPRQGGRQNKVPVIFYGDRAERLAGEAMSGDLVTVNYYVSSFERDEAEHDYDRIGVNLVGQSFRYLEPRSVRERRKQERP